MNAMPYHLIEGACSSLESKQAPRSLSTSPVALERHLQRLAGEPGVAAVVSGGAVADGLPATRAELAGPVAVMVDDAQQLGDSPAADLWRGETTPIQVPAPTPPDHRVTCSPGSRYKSTGSEWYRIVV